MPETDTAGIAAAAEDFDLLKNAAREAGVIAMGYFGKSPEVWMKGGTSPVSEADYAADTYLRETLLAARPDYGWLSEETADDPARLSARRTFVVDPIDGTRGFLEGRSTWCVSVAVVEAGRSLAGVLECPARQETYWAMRGQGAFRNGRPIRTGELGEILNIAGPKALLDRLPQAWQGRMNRVPHIPSLAYRLAMIADGSLDATFVKPNAHDWDIAAAELILTEAGGHLFDSRRRTPSYAGEITELGALVAGSTALVDELIDVLADAQS
ncbi:3'(2'),5'-bisphosphate nucleotidase CysQ [Mesorhizobium sp. BE184]|uniref:3'(2'),5'-bisphosphate nucleotidase CysQ n=1 Tax=Mesorhizobium sp. BE184 TaxID=2817714 RepID=UPI0028675DE6|nr:3'(2'),5'-bisphosphate nucleotidase CysQ [Mesorhizobium sp. BE184]MDR7032690.1 myo-inositol-1(or 4)-monophosphatase [Mesorhizobium sp. BE184]